MRLYRSLQAIFMNQLPTWLRFYMKVSFFSFSWSVLWWQFYGVVSLVYAPQVITRWWKSIPVLWCGLLTVKPSNQMKPTPVFLYFAPSVRYPSNNTTTMFYIPDEFDAYIIVSFVNATLVLSIGETVEEVTDSGFLGTTPTLSCSQLGDDALVQVRQPYTRFSRS